MKQLQVRVIELNFIPSRLGSIYADIQKTFLYCQLIFSFRCKFFDVLALG